MITERLTFINLKNYSKKVNNIHHLVYEESNIDLADNNARKNKVHRDDIMKHDVNREFENFLLYLDLKNLTYKTSDYKTFKIYEPKERIIFKLPYYPDRIAHHAIMNIMEPIWVKLFIKNTYSSIKGRGIHACADDVQNILRKDVKGTKYCLKIDIKKFYPSIDHDILFEIIKKKIKDKAILILLQEIISSTEGVPIGNYLSQFFANLYLTYFDHWVKETLKCKYYFRYADDIVILSDNKEFLRNVLISIKMYLRINLKLQLKNNYQIFPVKSRGIDFVGYKFYHTHTLLRKSIKQRMFKLIHLYKIGKVSRYKLEKGMQSYFGWLKFCNSKHLLQKIEKETGLKFSNWRGEKTLISSIKNKKITIVEVVKYKRYFRIHYIHNHKAYFCKSKNKKLYEILNKFLNGSKNIHNRLAIDDSETWQRFLSI